MEGDETQGRGDYCGKIKSHLTEESAIAKGVDPIWWKANKAADELADEASRKAAISEELAKEIGETDKLAAQIQDRLVEVAEAFPEELRKPPQETSLTTRRQRALDRAIERMAKITGHDTVKEGRVWKCGKCGKRGQAKKAVHWVRTKCGETAVPKGIYATHKHCRQGGLHYCIKCGAWGAQRFRKLAYPCPGWANRTGRLALRRLARGMLPHGIWQWPDPTAVG